MVNLNKIILFLFIIFSSFSCNYGNIIQSSSYIQTKFLSNQPIKTIYYIKDMNTREYSNVILKLSNGKNIIVKLN